jgi:hypothetical protein
MIFSVGMGLLNSWRGLMRMVLGIFYMTPSLECPGEALPRLTVLSEPPGLELFLVSHLTRCPTQNNPLPLGQTLPMSLLPSLLFSIQDVTSFSPIPFLWHSICICTLLLATPGTDFQQEIASVGERNEQ